MPTHMHASDWVLAGLIVAYFVGLIAVMVIDPKGLARKR